MIDPHLKAMLDAMQQAGFTLPDPLDADALRTMLDSPIPAPPAEIALRQMVAIDSKGASIPARLYHPEPGSVLPLTVFFHGGGWVHGTLETHDRLAATLANEAQCAVLSVDYRLAPEHPFPAAYEDAIAAVEWAKANAASLGCDAGRIALAGDSAGGNLVAAAARSLAGDPALRHQLLFYPALDANCAARSFDAEHPGFLSSAQMRWYWDQYAASGNRRELADIPDASPAAGVVSPDSPTATIVVAGNDPLHDEGVSYAEKLQAAGVSATLLSYPGAIHGFASLIGMVPLADEAVSAAAAALRDSFAD